MNNTNDYFDYQILHLTQQFFDDYSSPPYDEIIRKSSRIMVILSVFHIKLFS